MEEWAIRLSNARYLHRGHDPPSKKYSINKLINKYAASLKLEL